MLTVKPMLYDVLFACMIIVYWGVIVNVVSKKIVIPVIYVYVSNSPYYSTKALYRLNLLFLSFSDNLQPYYANFAENQGSLGSTIFSNRAKNLIVSPPVPCVRSIILRLVLYTFF